MTITDHPNYCPWMKRVIDETRSESEPCTKSTDGCCIDHEAETDRDGSCQSW